MSVPHVRLRNEPKEPSLELKEPSPMIQGTVLLVQGDGSFGSQQVVQHDHLFAGRSYPDAGDPAAAEVPADAR